MSDSNRGGVDKALIGSIVAAIAVICLYWAMFYDAGYQSGRHQERAQIERKHYAADTGERVERECAGRATKALRECVTEIVASERENKRNESDLAAQWQAADWVLWAAIIAGAQLVATVIGLYFIKGTLDATLKAVEDTGKATLAMEKQIEIAERGQRAWIAIEAITVDDGQINVTVRNFGHSPAKNFATKIETREWSHIFFPESFGSHSTNDIRTLVPNQFDKFSIDLPVLRTGQVFLLHILYNYGGESGSDLDHGQWSYIVWPGEQIRRMRMADCSTTEQLKRGLGYPPPGSTRFPNQTNHEPENGK